MTLAKDRLVALDFQTEGLRYVKTKSAGSLAAVKYEPPPRPKVTAKEVADEAETVAKKFEKLAADVNAAWDECERLHDKLWSTGADLSDVPNRPQIPGRGYSAGDDIRNDLVTVAGWLRVTSAKLKEAPKIPNK